MASGRGVGEMTALSSCLRDQGVMLVTLGNFEEDGTTLLGHRRVGKFPAPSGPVVKLL